VVVHICNPSAWEVEAGESRASSQLGLSRKTVSKKQKQTKKQKNPRKKYFLEHRLLHIPIFTYMEISF
jgi:hypothetical protein